MLYVLFRLTTDINCPLGNLNLPPEFIEYMRQKAMNINFDLLKHLNPEFRFQSSVCLQASISDMVHGKTTMYIQSLKSKGKCKIMPNYNLYHPPVLYIHLGQLNHLKL